MAGTEEVTVGVLDGCCAGGVSESGSVKVVALIVEGAEGVGVGCIGRWKAAPSSLVFMRELSSDCSC